MAKLLLWEGEKGTTQELKFTLGNSNSIPKADFPIYVFDRVTTAVTDKKKLWDIFLNFGMIPSYFQNIPFESIEFLIENEENKLENVIFNNKLLQEQAIYLISKKTGTMTIDIENSLYQMFEQEFINLILNNDARKCLKENYGEYHLLTLLSSEYALLKNECVKTNESIIELQKVQNDIQNYFSDYNHLREFYNINELMNEYIKKATHEREKVIEIQRKYKEREEKEDMVLPPEKITYDLSTSVTIKAPFKEETTRCLCLVLGNNENPLVLLEDSSYNLDEQIISMFNSSDNVRSKYKKKIAEYLDKNSDTLNYLRNCRKNVNYNGEIVILEKDSDGNFKRNEDNSYYRISVIYSSIWNKVRKLTVNIPKMKQLLYQDTLAKKDSSYSSLFSEVEKKNYYKALKKESHGVPTPYIKVRRDWVKGLRESSNKYEYLRTLQRFLAYGSILSDKKDIGGFSKATLEKTSKSTSDVSLSPKTILNGIQLYHEETEREYEEFLDENEYNAAFNPPDDDEFSEGFNFSEEEKRVYRK